MTPSPTKIYLKQPDDTFKQYGEELVFVGKNHLKVASFFHLDQPEQIFTISVEEIDGSTSEFVMELEFFEQVVVNIRSPVLQYIIGYTILGASA